MNVKDDIYGWIVSGWKGSPPSPRINSHDLHTVIHDYAARLGGALYLYIPEPPIERDAVIHDMFEVLLATGVISERPFFEDADRVHSRIRTMKPRLFENEPPIFRVHRVKEDQLRRLTESLDHR